MRCQECEEHLQSYLDESLHPALVNALNKHLRRCEACRQALDERRVIPARPALQVGEWIPPSNFVARTLRSAEAERDSFIGLRARAARRPWLRWALLAAALLALLAVPATRRVMNPFGTLTRLAATPDDVASLIGNPGRFASAAGAYVGTEVLASQGVVPGGLADRELAIAAQVGGMAAAIERRATDIDRWAGFDRFRDSGLPPDSAAREANGAGHYLGVVADVVSGHPRLTLSEWLELVRRGNRATELSLDRASRRIASVGVLVANGVPEWLAERLVGEPAEATTWVPALRLTTRAAATRATALLRAGRPADAAELIRVMAAFGNRLRREGELDSERRAGAMMQLVMLSLARAELSPDELRRHGLDQAVASDLATAAKALARPLDRGVPQPDLELARFLGIARVVAGLTVSVLLLGLLVGVAVVVHRLIRRRWPGPAPLPLGGWHTAVLAVGWLGLTAAVLRRLLPAGLAGEVEALTPLHLLALLPTVAMFAYLAALGGQHAHEVGAPRLRFGTWIDRLIECPEPHLSPRWDFVRRAWLALDWRLAALCGWLFVAGVVALAWLDHWAWVGPPAWLIG